MNNSTVSVNSSNEHHAMVYLTSDFVFQAINFIISFYLLIALTVYQVKIESKKTKTREKLFLNLLCFTNVLCAFVCVAKDVPILYMENKPGLFCTLMVNIAGGVPYFLGLATAFGLLWFRQRKLYSDPVLKGHMSKGFSVVNYLLLVCFLLLLLAIVVFFLYENDWKQVGSVCVQRFAGRINMLATTLSYCVLTVCCQVALFMFIAHPLTSCLMGGKKGENLAGDLRRMLKRLLVCTLGCCVSSLQLNVFVMLVEGNHVYLYWPNLCGLDLIITAVCVIGTFSNWQQRLFPFFKKAEEQDSDAEVQTLETRD